MNRDEMHSFLESNDWHYDNGWPYMDKSWSAYVRNETNQVLILERFPDEALILRNPYDNNREELWHGKCETIEDLTKLIADANTALDRK